MGLRFSRERRCRLGVVARTRREPYDMMRARKGVRADVTMTSLPQGLDLGTSPQRRTFVSQLVSQPNVGYEEHTSKMSAIITTERHDYHVSQCSDARSDICAVYFAP